MQRRALEVLHAVAQPGATRASVAHQLGISPHTVTSHLRQLYAELGVNSAAQAIARLTDWRPPPTER